MRAGILVAAGVLAFMALGYIVSYGLYLTGLTSAGNRDRLLHLFMTLGLAALVLSLIALVVRDGYRKARAARRNLRTLRERAGPVAENLARRGRRIRPGAGKAE